MSFHGEVIKCEKGKIVVDFSHMIKKINVKEMFSNGDRLLFNITNNKFIRYPASDNKKIYELLTKALSMIFIDINEEFYFTIIQQILSYQKSPYSNIDSSFSEISSQIDYVAENVVRKSMFKSINFFENRSEEDEYKFFDYIYQMRVVKKLSYLNINSCKVDDINETYSNLIQYPYKMFNINLKVISHILEVLNHPITNDQILNLKKAKSLYQSLLMTKKLKRENNIRNDLDQSEYLKFGIICDNDNNIWMRLIMNHYENILQKLRKLSHKPEKVHNIDLLSCQINLFTPNMFFDEYDENVRISMIKEFIKNFENLHCNVKVIVGFEENKNHLSKYIKDVETIKYKFNDSNKYICIFYLGNFLRINKLSKFLSLNERNIDQVIFIDDLNKIKDTYLNNLISENVFNMYDGDQNIYTNFIYNIEYKNLDFGTVIPDEYISMIKEGKAKIMTINLKQKSYFDKIIQYKIHGENKQYIEIENKNKSKDQVSEKDEGREQKKVFYVGDLISIGSQGVITKIDFENKKIYVKFDKNEEENLLNEKDINRLKLNYAVCYSDFTYYDVLLLPTLGKNIDHDKLYQIYTHTNKLIILS
jgi:hypothetical protein